MKLIICLRAPRLLAIGAPMLKLLALGALVVGALLCVGLRAAQTPPTTPHPHHASSSKPPARFTPPTGDFEYIRRDVMIPMRDGVKLHTVILLPKGAKGAPILLTRTPYNATALTSHAQSIHLGP